MPWLETSPMDLRESFVTEQQHGLYSMRELCERYGISRKTGYKWVERFVAGGRAALGDRGHAPHHCPHRIPADVAALLCAARTAHRSWGPAKLIAWLARRHPTRHWPATSPGDRRCRPGTSTRTPGQASPPACPPPPAPSSPTSETGNASSPPSTSGSRSHPVNTSSPRDLSRPSCLTASGNPGPSGQVHGNCWTPATPDLTTPA